MKRFVLLALLGIIFANATYAQSTKVDWRVLERKIDEALEKDKKAKEEKIKKEREKSQRHEQLSRQQEVQFAKQMNNLNSVSAGDYMTGPKQQPEKKGFRATTYKAEGNRIGPVASQRTNAKQGQTGSYSSRRSNFGTPSYSGNNYPGDKFANRPAGFGNKPQRQQVRIPASQIRGQYKPHRTMKQVASISKDATQKPKVQIQGSLQQRNISHNPQQPRNAQEVKKVQTSPQRQVSETSVNKKVAWVENGKTVLDNEKTIYLAPRTSSSKDLKPIDKTRIDYATKVNNISVNNLPNEAYYLSDRDNKITSANLRKNLNVQKDDLTFEELVRLAREDRASGFESMFDPVKFENIYGRYDAGTIRVPSRTAIQKR